MTILVLSRTDVPRDRRVHVLCRSLAEAGHEVIATGFGRPAEADGYVLKRVRPGRPGLARTVGAAIRQWPAAHLPALARLGYGLDAELGRMSHGVGLVEPELVWASGFATLTFGAEIKRRMGARLVYDARGEDPGAGPGSDGRFQRFREILEGEAAPKADHVVTSEGAGADALLQRYRLRSRPTVIADDAPAEDWLHVVDGLVPRIRRTAS